MIWIGDDIHIKLYNVVFHSWSDFGGLINHLLKLAIDELLHHTEQWCNYLSIA